MISNAYYPLNSTYCIWTVHSVRSNAAMQSSLERGPHISARARNDSTGSWHCEDIPAMITLAPARIHTERCDGAAVQAAE